MFQVWSTLWSQTDTFSPNDFLLDSRIYGFINYCKLYRSWSSTVPPPCMTVSIMFFLMCFKSDVKGCTTFELQIRNYFTFVSPLWMSFVSNRPNLESRGFLANVLQVFVFSVVSSDLELLKLWQVSSAVL